MKFLLKILRNSKKQYGLLLVSIVAIYSLTIASQLEMCSLGVLTSSGPDFFALFGKENKEKIEPQDHVTRDEVMERWTRIDTENTGVITKSEAASFMAKRDRNPLNQFVGFLNEKFQFNRNYLALAFMFVLIALYKAIGMFGSKYITNLVGIRISRDLRQKYFEHIQTLPMSFYHQHNIGGLSSRVIADASVVASSVNALLFNYLQTPFTLITTFCICLYLSVKLTLFIFFGLPLVIVPIVLLARLVKRLAKQMQRNQESFATILVEFLAGIQTVKAFAMEDFTLKKYKEQNDRMAVLDRKSARYGFAARPILHTITGLFLASVILYGTLVCKMSMSDILVFCGLLYLFYEPIKKFGDENAQIQRGIAAAERMFEVMDLSPEIQDAHDASTLTCFNHKIEFKNVWFRYEEEWILKDLSFTVEKGQMVAIVGPTGAGKSTIAQLLPRLYEVQKGEILIDGKPLQSFTQKSLRETIAFVPQKPFLFLDSIRENIAYGRDFTEFQIKEAARRAHAAEFIDTLPATYETRVSEMGKNLSGGQQQRLAIARALVKNAPILIMDEATSSLDAVSESRIKQAIKELHGSVTQILIAHRLTTIEDADKIIYLEKGIKIGEGPKEELLRSCPGFRAMWEIMHMPQNTYEKDEPVALV
ncbi:MAG: ABC transporter ATP-binding protein [Parachlamydiales bacterium]|nr:ABC transporter ATP-binding protein [Parachlamydiales bacterium]